MLNVFSYIITPAFSKEIKTDIEKLFLANNKLKTLDHVKAVAEKNMEIAAQYGLDINICELCGYLHDVSSVIKPEDMLNFAAEKGWYIDEAERKYPFILHQRISKVVAEQDFGVTNEVVLSAIECHSTLKTNPSPYDMTLFVADKLAWDQEGKPPFFQVVCDALKQSLEAASLTYMDYIVENKMILYPHKWFNDGVRFLRRVTA